MRERLSRRTSRVKGKVPIFSFHWVTEEREKHRYFPFTGKGKSRRISFHFTRERRKKPRYFPFNPENGIMPSSWAWKGKGKCIYKYINFPFHSTPVTGESKAAPLMPPNLPSLSCDNKKFHSAKLELVSS